MKQRWWVLKRPLTKGAVSRRLGAPTWAWRKVEARTSECGLADGVVSTAAYGDASACGRVWLHSDGVCIRGVLDIDDDNAYAAKMAQKLGVKKEETP